MASQGFSLLLQFYLLLLLVRPLDPSSRPERDRSASAPLPAELELQDTDPEATPWAGMALASWTCLLLVLPITGVVLGRRLWRWWREVREGVRQAGRGRPRGCWASRAALWPRPLGRGAEPQGQRRAEAAELCSLQPGPSLRLRGQRQLQWPQLRSAPSLRISVLCLAGAPEPLGLSGALLRPQADAAAEAQAGRAAAVPAVPPSAEAQGAESGRREPLEEEENPKLPSALSSSSGIAGDV